MQVLINSGELNNLSLKEENKSKSLHNLKVEHLIVDDIEEN